MAKRNFTKSELRILALLLMYGGTSHAVEITKLQLSETLSLSRNTVDESIRRLKAKGIVQVTTRFEKHGGNAANHYKVRATPDILSQVAILLEKPMP